MAIATLRIDTNQMFHNIILAVRTTESGHNVEYTLQHGGFGFRSCKGFAKTQFYPQITVFVIL